MLLWAILRPPHALHAGPCGRKVPRLRERPLILSTFSLNFWRESTWSPQIGPFASLFLPSFLFLPRLLPAKAPVRWFARGFDNSAAATAAAAASQSLTIFEFTNAARPKNASSSSLNWFDGHGAARSAKELCFFDIVNWLKYYRGLSQVPEIANASFGGRTVFARRFSRAALQQRRRNGI